MWRVACGVWCVVCAVWCGAWLVGPALLRGGAFVAMKWRGGCGCGGGVGAGAGARLPRGDGIAFDLRRALRWAVPLRERGCKVVGHLVSRPRSCHAPNPRNALYIFARACVCSHAVVSARHTPASAHPPPLDTLWPLAARECPAQSCERGRPRALFLHALRRLLRARSRAVACPRFAAKVLARHAPEPPRLSSQ